MAYDFDAAVVMWGRFCESYSEERNREQKRVRSLASVLGMKDTTTIPLMPPNGAQVSAADEADDWSDWSTIDRSMQAGMSI